MQGNDFVQSLMYRHGVTCYDCHDVHGTSYPFELKKPPNEMCAECHAPNSENGPYTSTIEAHTHHNPGAPAAVVLPVTCPRSRPKACMDNTSTPTPLPSSPRR